MFAGEGAGWATIVAADFAGGELMEEQAAGFVERLGGDDFAAEVAKVGEPVAGVEGELVVNLFAEALGEGWVRGGPTCGRRQSEAEGTVRQAPEEPREVRVSFKSSR